MRLRESVPLGEGKPAGVSGVSWWIDRADRGGQLRLFFVSGLELAIARSKDATRDS